MLFDITASWMVFITDYLKISLAHLWLLRFTNTCFVRLEIHALSLNSSNISPSTKFNEHIRLVKTEFFTAEDLMEFSPIA
jgi:hypothetical protein